MTVATYSQPDSTNPIQNPVVWGGYVDGDFSVHHRLAGPFAPHAAGTPNMTVVVDAGAIEGSGTITEVAQQTTGSFTAPIGNQRLDLVYIDRSTGAVGVVTGTPAGSPSLPALPAGKSPVASVLLQTSSTAITNSMISDLRTGYRALKSGAFTDVGTAATLAFDADVTLAADSDTRIATQKAVKTYVDAASGVDATARDWIAMTSLRVLLNTSVSSGALVNAYQWELGSDEWATGSSGYTFTAGTPGYYAPTPGSYSSNLCTGGTASASTDDGPTYSPDKAFDGSTATQWFTANGSPTPSWLQYTFAAAKTIRRYRIYGYSTSSQNVKSWTFEVYSGGSWHVIDTQANQTITTAWASYDVAAHAYSSTQYRINISANNGSSAYTGISEMEMMELSAPSDMTLVTPSVTTSSAATTVDFYFLYKDDSGSAVINTDLTVELSRDGGTTYTSATATLQSAFDATYSIYKATADVSGQPSGTSMKSRIKTLNSKAQRVGPSFIGKR